MLKAGAQRSDHFGTRFAQRFELRFVDALDVLPQMIGYLRQFPFDILKVDRSFVRDIGMNATANALIQSLVSLGDALNLSVIAEGIENEEQLKLLRLVQCEFVQGFLISRAIPVDEMVLLLKRFGEANGPSLGSGMAERKLAVSAAY